METNFKQVDLKKIQAPNFLMSPVELKDYIDFEVKRIYFITKPAGNTGAHCHKIEEEFFIMIQGSCIAVIDKDNGLEEFKLEGPTSALYVSKYVWHHFKNFSSDAILLALSSTNYNPNRSDYIENYEEFKHGSVHPFD
ncbi:MAG: FdtA/QdtA family cupin domain-containing protein [Patescibacteria group bacterium]